MKLEILNKNRYTLIRIKEPKIYQNVVDDFKEKILGLIEKGNVNIIMNFKDVKIINSSGLGILFLAWYRVKDKNGEIKITNLNPTIKEIFERLRLDKVFEIFENEDEAI